MKISRVFSDTKTSRYENIFLISISKSRKLQINRSHLPQLLLTTDMFSLPRISDDDYWARENTHTHTYGMRNEHTYNLIEMFWFYF